MRPEPCTPRKKLVQEAPKVILVRVLEQAAALEKPRRAEAGVKTGLLEGFRFCFISIRRVQQLVLQCGNLRGTFELRELRGPLSDLRLQAALLLQPGERQFERLLGGCLESALAAPVEVHGRAMQLHQDAGRLYGVRFAADVITSQALKIEFTPARAFPQELHVERFGKPLGLGQELASRRLLETQEHVPGLDLAAAAVR